MTQAPPPTNTPDAYREAGVDIALGNAFVAAIGPAVARTHRPGVMGAIGGFGGVFDLSVLAMTDPLLVAATDGVGTKLLLAEAVGVHRGLGIDLVAMSVNDIAVQGAQPLFFLDYFATGRLEPEVAAEVVNGVADACAESGCALLGGETAEMPGVYPPGRFDLAGFAVGAVERSRLLPRLDQVREGDVVLAVASSGLHSNGFSLVRRIVETSGADLQGPAPFAPATRLADALLTPTRLYVRACRVLAGAGASALAHVTGGGLLENLPRVMPQGTAARLDLDSYTLPPLFAWLAAAGALDRTSLARTFNCGIGLLAVVPAERTAAALEALYDAGETAWQVGEIVAGNGAPEVELQGGHGWPQA
ncbi:MAG: phosphoribosylformylglycinamidine cyclo-ligase [Geminicoccaceae bacterium]|nr:MAG: phosphoribosylformylglycinamidine cyclo-ligase [Geminicoccaceae bacterium]